MNQNLIKNLGLQGATSESQGVSEKQILDSEKNLKIRFPDGYKKFLRECGASFFTEDVVFTPIEPSPWAVDGNECFDGFYGISTDPGFDLCRINARLKNTIPNGTIAIGHDSGSNLILLSSDSGQVLFLDKDTGRTYLVAGNFENFLESFHRR